MRRSGPELTAIAGGLAVLSIGAAAARRPAVGRFERRLFAMVNGLPGVAHPPVWLAMQVGSLAGVVAVSVAGAASGDRGLAWRIFATGGSTWVVAKLAKRPVRRGRPTVELGGARVLGRVQSGSGYPSGHAAVAASLLLVVSPRLSAPARTAGVVVVGLVGAARMYVGAHLPLDVAGGYGLGVAAGVAGRRIAAQGSRSMPSSARSSCASWRRG